MTTWRRPKCDRAEAKSWLVNIMCQAEAPVRKHFSVSIVSEIDEPLCDVLLSNDTL